MEAPGPRSSNVSKSNRPTAPGIGVGVEVAAHPVVAVAEAVGEEPVPRIQQQAGGFDGAARNYDQVGGLLFQAAIGIVVGNAGGAGAVIKEDFPAARP